MLNKYHYPFGISITSDKNANFIVDSLSIWPCESKVCLNDTSNVLLMQMDMQMLMMLTDTSWPPQSVVVRLKVVDDDAIFSCPCDKFHIANVSKYDEYLHRNMHFDSNVPCDAGNRNRLCP